MIQSIGETGEVITTSQYPGTTLGQIDIPLDEHSSLVDTPGIIHRHQITHYLAEKEMKKVLPQKELQPKTFQLNSEQTIFIGGLIRVDYEQGERNSFTFYTPQTIDFASHEVGKGDRVLRKTCRNTSNATNRRQYEVVSKTSEEDIYD